MEMYTWISRIRIDKSRSCRLKEIAALCGINKRVSTHTARYTFATTVTLTNRVSIDVVAKMMGHTNIRTTQGYAKVTDDKISEDMDRLMERRKKKTNFNQWCMFLFYRHIC